MDAKEMGRRRWELEDKERARAIRSAGGKAAAQVKSDAKSAASRANLEKARQARLAKRATLATVLDSIQEVESVEADGSKPAST